MNFTVASSTTSTDLTYWVTSAAGSPLSLATLSMLHFTASALKGVPLENFTPLRSLKVYSSPSFVDRVAVASAGTILVVPGV